MDPHFDYDSRFHAHHSAWEERREEEDDASTFVVDRHVATPEDARPWLVWVHPGDACEIDSPDADTQVRARLLEEQMGEEVLAMLDSHRVFVIHRQSSVFAFEPWEERTHPAYAEAMGRCLADEATTLLWGDDLAAASTWLLEQRGPADTVFLTGAWRHREWGCVTAVGEALVAGGMAAEVSAHSPSEPGTTVDGWTPAATIGSVRVSTTRRGGGAKP